MAIEAEKELIQTENQIMPKGLILLLSVICGLFIANLYYTQPILTAISQSLDLADQHSGLILTVAQIGYTLSVIFILPLADAFNNRKLLTIIALGETIALLTLATCKNSSLLFVNSFFLGFFTVGGPIIIAFAVYLVPKEVTGRALTLILMGLFAGMGLSRTISTTIATALDWRYVYYLAASCMAIVTIIIYTCVPNRKTEAKQHHVNNPVKIIKSLFSIFRSIPSLPLRLISSSLSFMSLIMFWTVLPIFLAQGLGLDGQSIAFICLFSLVTPLFITFLGQLLDRNLSFYLISIGIILAFLAWLIAAGSKHWFIAPFLAVVAMEIGINSVTTSIQHKTLALNGEAKARLNTLFLTANFLGGALGSSLGTWIFFSYSSIEAWYQICFTGVIIMIIAFLINLVVHKKFEAKDKHTFMQ